MLVLGIDTSGKSGGVTLAEGDQASFRAIESSPIVGGTFSAQLVPTIASILESHGVAAKQIDGFAVASGPGSFTGLRVGLSAVKGFVEILGKPIVRISLLDALALRSGKQGRLASALDAGRSELFFGLYQSSSLGTACIAESLLTRPQFLDHLSATDLTVLVTSDESVAELASSSPGKTHVVIVPRPDSVLMARIGLKKLLTGETVSVEALDANYLRRSDAEIFSKGPR